MVIWKTFEVHSWLPFWPLNDHNARWRASRQELVSVKCSASFFYPGVKCNLKIFNFASWWTYRIMVIWKTFEVHFGCHWLPFWPVKLPQRTVKSTAEGFLGANLASCALGQHYQVFSCLFRTTLKLSADAPQNIQTFLMMIWWWWYKTERAFLKLWRYIWLLPSTY